MSTQYFVSIDSFDQIEERICKDLCWYLVYEAVRDAREQLHIEGDASDLPKNKTALYEYALRVYLTRTIEAHIFLDSKVEVSLSALHEALEYFALHVPLVPTFQLSLYLNYLEGWSHLHPDWTQESPTAFENLEFEFLG